MKQVTGNNTTAPSKDVSIQVNLGGHSFSASDLSADALQGEGNVEFVINTHKVTLVPQCAFEEALSAQYLAAVGLECAAGETTVCSEMQAPTIAVMAIDRNALNAILAALGTRAKFTSPLLDERHDGSCNIAVRIVEGVAYFRIFDSALRLAEAVAVKSADDVLFYALELAKATGLATDTPIYIKGAPHYGKLLKHYFKHVVCE